ncbi:MAG: hypothetical protein WC747_03015 [Candidatus Babeliales bacterium]|jgi:hypothetical protein
MFKKLMLILTFSSAFGTNTVKAQYNDSTPMVAAAVVAGVVIVGAIYYWATQEPTDVKANRLIAYYTPIMASWNFSTNEQDLTKLAIKVCEYNSLYPVSDAIQQLSSASYFLRHQYVVPCDPILIDKMVQLHNELFNSVAYLQEKRIRQEIELQKRLVWAAENAARAARDQADTAKQQAKGQKR